jgi:DNA-binding transcriptional ArsR family regulator
MKEPKKTYVIETLEQMRALADTLRIRIIEALMPEALTITQLGARLDEAPAKILYHIRELEKVGLVALVEKREKGGNLEKYYRAIAENISISSTFIRSAPLDATLEPIQKWLIYMQQDVLDALARAREEPDMKMRLSTEGVWLAREEIQAFWDELNAVLEKYEQPRGGPGEQQWRLNLLFYPERSGAAPPPLENGEATRPEET